MREDSFPAGFFDRADASDDGDFYRPQRLVTHIDDQAIATVGALYAELAIGADNRPVLDLMSSWVSHFQQPPVALTVLGMNQYELDANSAATHRVVHDLNREPTLPFATASFAAAVCCVSVDYLAKPFEVFDEVARVLQPGSPFVATFSNRCFPTKVIRGWLSLSDEGRCELVATYFRDAQRDGVPAFEETKIMRRTPPQHRGDPLFAVVGYTVAAN
jgi:SAM-dependent methyltransferase